MPYAPSRNLLPRLSPCLALALALACSSPPPETSPPASAGAADAAAGQAGERPVTASASTAPTPAEPPAVPPDTADLKPDKKPPPGAKWGDATIPAGAEIVALLQERLDSGSARTGAIVRARTEAPFSVGDVVVLPAGSMFDGLLGQIIPANEGKETGGTIALRWRLVRTPVGTAAALKARVKSAEAAPGGSAGLSIAGAEAVVEGGSGGTVLAAGTRGEELILEKGTRLTLVMSEPVPIKVRL